MVEQFVTWEIAEKLKQLGFNEQCLLTISWVNDREHKTKMPYEPEAWIINHKEVDYNFAGFKDHFRSKYSVTLHVPLWQQAIEFLKGKNVLVTELWDGWEVGRDADEFDYYDSKEEAVLEGIKLCQS